jgi:hypothetical protein
MKYLFNNTVIVTFYIYIVNLLYIETLLYLLKGRYIRLLYHVGNLVNKDKGNTSVVGVSANKPSFYYTQIKIIKHKPEPPRTVQITVEKQVVKDRTVTITILPQAIKNPNKLAKSSHLTIQNQLFEHKKKEVNTYAAK